MRFFIEEWKHLLGAWLRPQIDLSNVERWGFFKDWEEGPILRAQNTLQHTHSLVYLCEVLCARLSPYVCLDELLLIRACLNHDVGEGLVGEDTPYIYKTNAKDALEYQAFRLLHCADGLLWPKIQRAFLLQFSRKRSSEFSEEALIIMNDLWENNRNEVLAFEAVERWDYLLYPLEHTSADTCHEIMVSVIKNQYSELEGLADELPGFREAVWTREIADKFKELL